MAVQTVHVGVYEELADWEASYAMAQIGHSEWQREPGRYRVATVAERPGTITTMGGLRVQPDMTLDQLSLRDSAMLILPGAGSWDAGGNGAFAAKARQALEAGVPVAAICGATFGLAVEGLLDDREHTSGAAEYLAASGYAGGERYRDEPVVVDGDLITAGPVHAVSFARAIFERLELFTPDVLEAWYGLNRTGEPEHFFALMAALEAGAPAASAA